MTHWRTKMWTCRRINCKRANARDSQECEGCGAPKPGRKVRVLTIKKTMDAPGVDFPKREQSSRASSLINALCFLVVDTKAGAFGKSDDFNEAVRICKQHAGVGRSVRELKVIAFDCDPMQIEILADVNLNYVWPKDATALRFTVKL